MLNMRTSTSLLSAPSTLTLFFVLNLPVNQQKPVIRKSKKAPGIHDEQKCHTLEGEEKTLRNCGSLTMLSLQLHLAVLELPPLELLHTGTNRTQTCPLFKDHVLRHLCFLITVFFRFVFLNGSRLECNKKETILNVL